MTQRHPETIGRRDVLRTDAYAGSGGKTGRGVVPHRRLPTSFIHTGVTIESHRHPTCVVAQSSCWTNPQKGTGHMITHDVCIDADGTVRIEVNGMELSDLDGNPAYQ